jgi:hypothetical protein
MKTNRLIMFFDIFLCSCLVFAASAWPAEQKSVPSRQQITSPAAVAPAKAQPAATVKANTNVQPQIVFVSPNEGATFWVGQTCNIQWTAIGIPAGSKMEIEFIRPSLSTMILGSNLSIPGNLQWKINEQEFLEPPYNYNGKLHNNIQGKLKLTTIMEGKTYESERPVSISLPGLKITNPKSGDILQIAKPYNVTWQYTGPSLPQVYIIIGAGVSYAARESYRTTVANTGSTSITIPESALFDNWKSGYWLKVVSAAEGETLSGKYIYDVIGVNIIKIPVIK